MYGRMLFKIAFNPIHDSVLDLSISWAFGRPFYVSYLVSFVITHSNASIQSTDIFALRSVKRNHGRPITNMSVSFIQSSIPGYYPTSPELPFASFGS